MRVQFASDLHLNSWATVPFEKLLHPTANTLVLAGDIGHPESVRLRSFFKWCSLRWETIFWIPGHHELTDAWHIKIKTYEECIRDLRSVISDYSNIILLDRDAFVTSDGFVFLGCPLWSRLTSMSEELSKDPIAKEITKRFEGDVQWLRAQLKQSSLPVIIATHYPPTYTLLHRDFITKPTSAPFSLETETLLRPPVVAWICGYIHEATEVHRPYMDAEGTTGKVLLVSNALGYPDDHATYYRKDAVLRLGKS